MLRLPNYSEDCVEVLIMKEVAKIHPESYLITVKFLAYGVVLPQGLFSTIEGKIRDKLPKSFKFIHQESGWRLLVTCISGNEPIEKSFSLVNDFVKLCKKD